MLDEGVDLGQEGKEIGLMPNHTVSLKANTGCDFEVKFTGKESQLGGFNFIRNETNPIDILLRNTEFERGSDKKNYIYKFDKTVSGRVAVRNKEKWNVLLLNNSDKDSSIMV